MTLTFAITYASPFAGLCFKPTRLMSSSRLAQGFGHMSYIHYFVVNAEADDENIWRHTCCSHKRSRLDKKLACVEKRDLIQNV